MREMGFKKSMDLIPSAVPTIQPQTPQQKAFSEMRKRTMESEETEQTVGKSSKRSRKSRAIQKMAIKFIEKLNLVLRIFLNILLCFTCLAFLVSVIEGV